MFFRLTIFFAKEFSSFFIFSSFFLRKPPRRHYFSFLSYRDISFSLKTWDFLTKHHIFSQNIIFSLKNMRFSHKTSYFLTKHHIFTTDHPSRPDFVRFSRKKNCFEMKVTFLLQNWLKINSGALIFQYLQLWRPPGIYLSWKWGLRG